MEEINLTIAELVCIILAVVGLTLVLVALSISNLPLLIGGIVPLCLGGFPLLASKLEDFIC